MKEKLRLVPLKVNWRACSYGIHFEGHEDDALIARTVVTVQNGTTRQLSITFSSFAEVRFFNINFGEYHYGEYLVRTPDGDFAQHTVGGQKYDSFFETTGICPDPYFYEVENTDWFNEKEAYKRLIKRGFKHFILVGYDSYLEVLAMDDMTFQLTDLS